MLIGYFDMTTNEVDAGMHPRYRLEVYRVEDNPVHGVRAYDERLVYWLDEPTVLPWLQGDDSVMRPGLIGLQGWLGNRDQAFFDDLNAHFDELLNQD